MVHLLNLIQQEINLAKIESIARLNLHQNDNPRLPGVISTISPGGDLASSRRAHSPTGSAQGGRSAASAQCAAIFVDFLYRKFVAYENWKRISIFSDALWHSEMCRNTRWFGIPAVTCKKLAYLILNITISANKSNAF